MISTVNNNSSLLAASSLAFVAVTAIAVSTKVALVAGSIVTLPLALNIVATEYTTFQMDAFEISTTGITLTLAGLILLGIGTSIASFIFLPLPMAFIFTIATTIICINNFNRIDYFLEHEDGGYAQRYKTLVTKENNLLKDRISKIVVDADDKARADNQDLFEKLNNFTKKRSELPLEYKVIEDHHREIIALNAAIDKLSASA